MSQRAKKVKIVRYVLVVEHPFGQGFRAGFERSAKKAAELIEPALLDVRGEPLAGAPLGAILTAQTQRDGQAPALTIGSRILTRGELEAATNRRARWFSQYGVASGDAVVIAVPNGIVFYESVLACWKLGAIPAPVSWQLTDTEFGPIAELAEPKLIVGREAIGSPYRSVGEDDVPPADIASGPHPPIVAASWKMATTGGSTGAPKLVVDAAPGRWGPEKNAIGRRSGMTIINPAPLYHAAPFGLIIPAILQGCHVIEMERFDAERWLELVERHAVEWAYMVPTMMTRIARLSDEVRSRHDISSIKAMLHLAAPCPAWVKRFWIELLGAEAIWEIYGGAERLGSTIINGRDWLDHPGSVGRPGSDTLVEIRDGDGLVLPPGSVGEIYLCRSSPGSTLRTTEGEITQGGDWGTFGDLGWLDEDGFLYIADRRTDMILCGGANIYPSEIESALCRCAGVVDAVVVGLPDDDLGNRPHAIVQVGPIGPDEQELRGELSEILAQSKHPRSFEFIVAALRDEAGKVRRSVWRARAIERLRDARQ